ncbi:hypothetical protein [Marinoscillum sp. MHG1-6]|uniref:hypothetical protein n=1 Tax=Marinoscillum sp. MHG1-6 TaxID=2959627 RepID=UPI002157ED40|nr:hypothetical protein [Marinoscillum sp. MHG1-6]
MTLDQLYQRNEKFQREAAKLAELLPGGNMLEYASMLIRGAKKIDVLLQKLIAASGERSFYGALDRIEEEMDEILFMLDKLDEASRAKNVEYINSFLKRGYDLMSIYSICCDQLIERRIKTNEFEAD